jgi:hypothetical protein
MISFITHSVDTRQTLDHIGADFALPPISPTRGPPLLDDCVAQAGCLSQIQADSATGEDKSAEPAPDYEVSTSTSVSECSKMCS